MNVHTLDGLPADAAWVIARFEEAGRTLLALHHTGPSTRLVQSGLEWVRDAAESCDTFERRIHPAVPSAAHISRMDRTYQWLSQIPEHKYMLRRIVGARSLIHPVTDRRLYSWRRLGNVIGASHAAVRQWHAQGIDLIVSNLNREHPWPTPMKPTQIPARRPARLSCASWQT